MASERRPRILVVGPFPPTKGGVTTFMLNLTGSFLKDRFDFVPFTTSRPPKKGTLNNYGYAAMFRGGIGRVSSGIGITVWHIFKFPFVLVSGRIDVVQVQASDYQAFWESAAYVWMARRLGKPVVLRIGGAFDIFHAASPSPCPAADPRRSEPAPTGDRPIRHGARHDRGTPDGTGPILVVPNWAENALIRNIKRPARAVSVFLFIAGSDAHRKGVKEVLEAAERLAAKGSAARFHILAAPEVLQRRIAQLNLPNIAVIEGFVPHARVVEVMGEADVLLLPSHGEGVPNTLIEAMACGLPSIVTPVGGVPEIIRDGGAMLVAVKDAQGLAGAIETLTLDAVRRRRMGQAALANLQSRYTAERVLPRLGEAYQGLVHPKSP